MPSSVSPSSTAAWLATAARVVAQVVHEGRALDDALQRELKDKSVPRSAVQAVSFGTLRWYPRLAKLIDMLAARPAGSMQPEVATLLAVALHQLNFSHHPDHAVVNATVDATKLIGRPRASGFVNAILRSFLRDKEGLRARAEQDPDGKYAHPPWMIERMREDWPEHWREILEANNRQPPMWLRANRLQVTAEDYVKVLNEHGLQASLAQSLPDAVLLAEAVDVDQLPGFATGTVSVQDAGAQVAAELLDARPGMRVLDACAAPGGKACHILERVPNLSELVLVERSASRNKQIDENLARLRLDSGNPAISAKIRLVVADAANAEEWWTDELGRRELFDRILVDVPCSATGVIRRHPDIKLLRRPTDIASLAAGQLRLVKGLWPLLRPGGRMLYVSCSVLHAENGRVVRNFMEQEPAARVIDLSDRFPAGLRPTDYGPKDYGSKDCGPRDYPGRQILPGAAGMDGFYYACLEKTDA